MVAAPHNDSRQRRTRAGIRVGTALVLVVTGLAIVRWQMSASGDVHEESVVAVGAGTPPAGPGAFSSSAVTDLEDIVPTSSGGAGSLDDPESKPAVRSEGVSLSGSAQATLDPIVFGPVEAPRDTTASLVDTDKRPADAQAKAPAWETPASGEALIWHDGDRERQVWVDPRLVVNPEGADIAQDSVVASFGGGVITRSDRSADAGTKVDPVFRSESGGLMALPGGVLLVLDAGWDPAQVDDFFDRNAIHAGVEELEFIANAFFIETASGFASLNLANALAVQAGVEISSPNWWVEVVTK